MAHKIGKIKKSFFAGYFDGDGTVGTTSNTGNTRSVRVSISSVDPIILHELKEFYGGFIICAIRKNLRQNNLWLWYVCANKATKFLVDILPYLRIKKERARLAIEFQKANKILNMKKRQKIKKDISKQIKRLNFRGLKVKD